MTATVADYTPTGPRQPDAAGRSRLFTETVLVLALTLGQSAVYAILRIIERMTRPEPLSSQTSTINSSVTPDRPWLDLAYQLANIGFGVVPALLAVHLLATHFEPAEGWREALSQGGRKLGFDSLWGFLIFAGIGIPGIGLYLGARWLGVNTNVAAANLAENWWTTPVLIASAAMNGILEEVVVVGYLFTRWRQVGWGWVTIVVTSAIIRGSYHLYQGWGGFVGNIIMGLIFGYFFLKTRRVWPLVIAHTLLDIAAFLGYAALKGHVSWL